MVQHIEKRRNYLLVLLYHHNLHQHRSLSASGYYTSLHFRYQIRFAPVGLSCNDSSNILYSGVTLRPSAGHLTPTFIFANLFIALSVL